MNKLVMPDDVTRAGVYDWEKFVSQDINKHAHIELECRHHFSHGVYARELHIPAGTILTGEIHKFENLNILSKGRISVLTENGMQEVEAPFTIVSPAGTKRIAYAHTDCIWTTIHGTFDRDVDKIKNHFIAASEQEWLEFSGANQLQLGFV